MSASRLAFENVMFVIPGPPSRRKTGVRRVRRAGPDAGDRQRDQPRARVGAVLGHDERAAVGGVAARLGGVVARVQVEVAGLRALRAPRPVAVGREAEVAETEHEQPDHGEGDDAGGGERVGCFWGFM